jgi:hypothetical protein
MCGGLLFLNRAVPYWCTLTVFEGMLPGLTVIRQDGRTALAGAGRGVRVASGHPVPLENVSPRRNRPRPEQVAPLDGDGARRGVEGVQSWRDGEWQVRGIPGSAAVKTYRCPGCDQEIRPGVAHLVVWPADGRGDLTDRRHWHSGCWRARDRRGPGVQRSRGAPRYG